MSMESKHPPGLYFLFTIEMWERFSYYGMRALLVLYMYKVLLFSSKEASHIYGIYTGLVFATPLLGGYLADKYLGARKCILIGAILMALGEFILAVPSVPFLYVALGFLILGNGFFKPNISTIVGKLYENADNKRDAGFTIFYMGINLGAFLAPLVCGTLGEKFGFHYGFIAAGVGMLIGTAVYLWGQHKYLDKIGLEAAAKKEKDPSKENKSQALTTKEKQRIAFIFTLMFFNIFFWASFEQAGSSLTLFADKVTNRIIPFLNWEFPVSYFQSVNPLLILLLAPIFSSIWISLANRKKEPSTVVKFGLGLIFVALGFLLVFIASQAGDVANKVSPLWLIGVYLFHTIGELCISPVGLSMVSRLAPIQFASLLMGVWFSSIFFANLMGGYLAGMYNPLNPKIFFLYPLLLTLVPGVILLFLNKPLKKLFE